MRTANNIGERLKEIRVDWNMTQAAFAGKVGLSQGFIANCEKGKYNLTTEHINRIAYEFDANPGWMLTGQGNKYKSDDIEYPKQERLYLPEAAISPEDENLLQIVKDVPGARELLEVIIALPERKRKIYLGRMLDDLDKLEESGGKE